jgi:hypothetical protein
MSNQQRGMQLGGGGGLGGLGQRAYQQDPQQHNGFSQWSSHHSDYYYPNYNPGYAQQSYSHYPQPQQQQRHQRNEARERCALHGKMRTVINLIEVAPGEWQVRMR